MGIKNSKPIEEILGGNTYPGRGIVVGKSADGKSAVGAYFIMGRSENSRNRVFSEKGTTVVTEPFDASKVADPSLILYTAVRAYKNKLILTNGDQTDTVASFLREKKSFRAALESREFEPDSPNFTPRISAMLCFEEGDFSYEMSILKSADAHGSACNRFFFCYEPLPGTGHLIHTYQTDGEPLPSFQGEPVPVEIPDGIGVFTDSLWQSLNEENKVSLYVRYTDPASGETETRLVNKHRKC